MTAIKRHKIEIDAQGMVPGRLATRIATILLGKHKPSYEAHVDSGDKVVVLNVSGLRFTGKKLEDKVIRHHSMHPGGLKEIPWAKIFKENPSEVVMHAVAKMLPKNKTRAARLKRISFK